MNRMGQVGSKAVVLVAVALLVALAWLDLLDAQASRHTMGVMMESLAAFGIARVLNGVISVLQSVQLSIGVASVTVGEALDPLNDLVEMYATLMKLSIGSLIIQNILLEIVSTLFFKVLIAVAGLLLVVSVLLRGLAASALPFRLFVFSVFLRFAVVLAVGCSSLVDSFILEQRLAEKVQHVDSFSQQVDLADTESRASAELRQSLNADLQAMQEREQHLLADIETRHAAIAEQELLVAEQQRALEAKRQSMDTLSRLWASDPEYRALSQGLADLQMALSRQVRERAAVEEELQATRQATDATRNALQGRTDGFLDRLKNSISGLSSFKARIDQLVGSFDNIMEDLIYIMSAFLFRTLLMPLVFLYAFLKGFRLIWGVDLRTALQRGHAEMRRELRPGGREA
ncbi:MAG TPA: hypothetical protein VKY70_07940 [Pseudomonas sp.]|nr:hypothetical protein [Pseudomonas sp.]